MSPDESEKTSLTVRQAVNILREYNQWRRGDETLVMQQPKLIGQAIDVVIATVETPLCEQNARHAIDGAIEYGKQNINPPPSEEHWLMPYWTIGRELASQFE